MSADEQNKEAAFMGDSTAVTAGELRENPFLLRPTQDDAVASYLAMLKAFQGSKTAEGPSQQGLGQKRNENLAL